MLLRYVQWKDIITAIITKNIAGDIGKELFLLVSVIRFENCIEGIDYVEGCMLEMISDEE